VFGISTDNVVTHRRGEVPPADADEGVVLVRHRPDPTVERAGVDRVRVVRTDEDRYRVDYHGADAGRLSVTPAGVAELGATLLGDTDPVPGWLFADPPAPDDRPWWVPDGYDGRPTAACDRCGERTDAADLLVPGLGRGGDERFCRDCWARVRGRWCPEAARRGPALDDDGGVAALVGALEADDPGTRRSAAEDLAVAAAERPEATVDAIPALAAHAESDDPVVRAAAFEALGALAEDAPHRSTPAVDAAVTALDDPVDDAATGAARVVAGVAAERPDAVLGAVPRLATLLGADRVPDGPLVHALDRVGETYPSAVLPAVDALFDHAESPTAETRAVALTAVGRAASAHPSAVESSVSRLTALFDADDPEVRAAAARVLADVADHRPEAVAPVAERVVPLVADDDEAVRREATSALAGVGRTAPDRVRDAGAVGPLVDALDAEIACTRSNAAWLLGHVGACDARDALAARRRDDPETEVREAASWALDRLEESAG
jgi:hypothetical protein